MNKEKKIEEIRQVINEHYHNGNIGRKKSLSEKIYDKIITENEVVISKEEYERLKSLAGDKCRYSCGLIDLPDFEIEKKLIEYTRKETAEEFAKELRNFIYLCDDLELDADTYKKISNKMDEIAKQYGVEIGEEV